MLHHRLCLFTASSEAHWASVLTQVAQEQTDIDVQEQDHQPLAFFRILYRRLGKLEYRGEGGLLGSGVNEKARPLHSVRGRLSLHRSR